MPKADAIETVEHILRRELAKHNLARRTETIRGREQQEPLRRRALSHLSTSPSSPKDLAVALGTAPETISRLLKKLEAEGLVSQRQDEQDGRRRIFSLTATGDHALNDHYAFGDPEPLPEPIDSSSVLDFLGDVVDLAVSERRHYSKLDDAKRRLDVVVREASRVGAQHVEVRARRELVTTLRQAELWDEMYPHLETLKSIAEARAGYEPGVVLTALAHHEYELGRIPAQPRRQVIARGLVKRQIPPPHDCRDDL